ncbi:phage tail family protein [Ectobacillus sp. JY-23]|uniref:distal tail protein Dit n=1 Tax=Ectobacillus sp. JY-23 TaxID=2933872 RepID=UPI001FF20CA5|nr:distal tail protein Dit [Ectobacillus sp. JY-23]UOY92903.1 phage tail family protein [Ectobacillus sp. JY-23]
MFTFNGIHASTYGIKVISVSRPPLPAIKNTFVEPPGRNGAYFAKSALSKREIAVKIKIKAISQAALRTNARNIAKWLHNNRLEAPLIFDDEPDKVYIAITDGTDWEEIFRFGDGTIRFVCADPCAESSAATNITLTSNGNKIINVTGTSDVSPVITITFTGATTNLSIKHVEKNEVIKLVKAFVSSDTLIIDCRKGFITLNGTNIMPALDLSSDFWSLYPGTNTINCTTFLGTMTLTYKDKWL